MGWTGAVTPRCRHKNAPLSPRGDKRVSYPLLLSRARTSRSVIRVKTPFIAGVYTEYSSLLHDMDAAIAAPGWLWKNFIDKVYSRTDTVGLLDLRHSMKPFQIKFKTKGNKCGVFCGGLGVVMCPLVDILPTTELLVCVVVSVSKYWSCARSNYTICTLTLPPRFLGNAPCSSINDGGAVMCLIVFVKTRRVSVPGDCCL